ncbi:MAG: FHA domain-containing protein [Myxococcales bacterium]|nr:FHA domain-containing protein [Myxococcales bacterium]MCB9712866.1 FHA domain-containing protein [Myxococcales bacterium]
MPHYKLRLGGNTMVLPEGAHDVGRSSDCWLTLQDELSSRVHARFHVTFEEIVLEDLDSRNGTYVNGDRLQGRRTLRDGDRVRIGRELMTLVESETVDISDASAQLRQTLAPGEMSGMPELMGQLIDKALKVGKPRDAERYASALHKQLTAVKVPSNHPAASKGVECLLRVAEHTGNGEWVDKVFRLAAHQRWVLDTKTLEQIRGALDRIPRIPGSGLQAYEQVLRELGREGVELSPSLVGGIGELVDAYAGR